MCVPAGDERVEKALKMVREAKDVALKNTVLRRIPSHL
jgi:hypothetical protein